MSEKYKMLLQIDIKHFDEFWVRGSLTYNGRDCLIKMTRNDYELLKLDGFFIRSDDRRDRAEIRNTTLTYTPENHD